MENRHYTYTLHQDRDGNLSVSIQIHGPDDRPACEGIQSFTIFAEGNSYASECHRCENWGGFGETREEVSGRMWDRHRMICDDDIYENASHDRQMEVTMADMEEMRRYSEYGLLPFYRIPQGKIIRAVRKAEASLSSG